ncbi:hypothetical protein BN2476_270035 [Paraburkholderia piptadeniae]|uniref:Uncharacterized protein n=1 Tax=Paraburkholderia piptadeniae TaxID=1701573 RepID=A0A1N7S1K1_9BURK|nr:hypothetical protein [Paraburkholderia piptadeniae]SIT41226.1 hypothetical protein BN2476_270035 [Paraburkholderia piptadeniae]
MTQVDYQLLLKPSLMESVGDFFEMLLDKADSASGIERSAWSRQAVNTLFDTYGFGVGIGSPRASRFPLILLSNLGIVGTMFFCAFVLKSVMTPIPDSRPAIDRMVCYASRQAMSGVLVVTSISGTSFDLGPCFYLFAAAAAGLSSPARRVPASARAKKAEVQVSPFSGQTRQPCQLVHAPAPPALPLLAPRQRARRVPAWPHSD